MKANIEILIAGRDKAEIELLKDELTERSGATIKVRWISNGHTDPLYGLAALPDILIVCVSEGSYEDLEELARRSPEARPPVLVVAPSGDPDVMRLSMQAGARDFFARPLEFDSLAGGLQQIIDERAASGQSRTEVTVLINARGGCGASLLAANLAHVMASTSDQRVALIDMDLQFGNLGLYLDLDSAMGVADALHAVADLDAVGIDAFMARYRNGLRVMTSGTSPLTLAGEVPPASINRLLHILTLAYDHVVIDLPRHIDALTLGVIERANHIVICMEQRVTHLKDACRLRSILRDDIDIEDGRIMFVVNRYDAKDDVSLDDLRGSLGSACCVPIPNDHQRATENVNLGVPLYEQSRSAPITKALQELADKVRGRVSAPRRGLLGRVFSGLHPH